MDYLSAVYKAWSSWDAYIDLFIPCCSADESAMSSSHEVMCIACAEDI